VVAVVVDLQPGDVRQPVFAVSGNRVLPLTPGFSQVWTALGVGNGFNRFRRKHAQVEAVKTASPFLSWRTPG